MNNRTLTVLYYITLAEVAVCICLFIYCFFWSGLGLGALVLGFVLAVQTVYYLIIAFITKRLAKKSTEGKIALAVLLNIIPIAFNLHMLGIL